MTALPGSGYRLWLAGAVTPTLNVALRQHWRKRGQSTRALAWAVRAAVGAAGLPAAPILRARVAIERHSAGTAPDHDGLVGGCKGLIDCLLPFHEKRRPYGLGFITDDSPQHLELVVHAKRVRRADVGMLVLIEPLPPL